MLLEVNPLVLPDIGLVIWTTLAFLILLFLLGKFAWKPIMKAIGERESGIAESLALADRVRAEMAQSQNENEALMAKAREERAAILKDAKETGDKIVNEAKDKAKVEANKIMADNIQAINNQKMAALTEVKNAVGKLVVEVSEKVLRRELANKPEQEQYIKQLASEVNLN